MDTHELHVFCQTYESPSFAAAAKKAFMTPQGVAKIIGKLEQELAVPLFARTSLGITPTAAAYNLYQRAETLTDLLATVSATQAQVAPMHRSVVNLFATMGFLDMLGWDFFAPFYQAHPEVILNLVEFPDSALTQALNDHKTNLAFVAGVDFETFDATFMQTNEYAVIMSPDCALAKAEVLTPALLASVPQAIMGREFAVMARHRAASKKAGGGDLCNRVLETGNVNYIIDFAKQNQGLGIVQKVRLGWQPLAELLAAGSLITRPTSFSLNRDVFFISRDVSLLTPGEQALKAYVLTRRQLLVDGHN